MRALRKHLGMEPESRSDGQLESNAVKPQGKAFSRYETEGLSCFVLTLGLRSERPLESVLRQRQPLPTAPKSSSVNVLRLG